MQDYRLRVGMRFMRQGREYEILESLRGRKLKVRDIECGACFAQGVEELVGDLFAGKIELLGEDSTRPLLLEILKKNRVTDLTMLDDDSPLKRELLRRKEYVEEALGASRGSRSQEALSQVIHRVKERIRDVRPPSPATLRRWNRIYLRSGQDVRALAPSFKARGNGKKKFAGKRLGEYTEEDYERAKIVAAIVARAIKIKYLTREQLPISDAHEEAEIAVRKEN